MRRRRPDAPGRRTPARRPGWPSSRLRTAGHPIRAPPPAPRSCAAEPARSGLARSCRSPWRTPAS
ncbi:hypothetical protein ESP62_015310 [Aeromicrobium fastidiosum]|uniref:Uncharacterized protein n=1 Tax=Aeromicrobium fastidiosum TaxID=52699 RepID=A0A641AJ92_9ACTN|nr:hypothetical protein ESP62_015310 [Aeromicrobium fastidiosum]